MGELGWARSIANSFPATSAAESPILFAGRLLDALTTSSSADDLVPKAAAAILEDVGECTFVYLRERGTDQLRLAGWAHRETKKHSAVHQLAEDWLKIDNQRRLVQLADLREPKAVKVANEEQAKAVLGEVGHTARRLGLATILLIPLVYEGRRYGLLAIGSQEADQWSQEQNVVLASQISRHLSAAIAHLQRVEMTQQVSQQLALSSLRFQTIIENIPQGVIIADLPDGRITSSNTSAVRLLGREIDPQMPPREYAKAFDLAKANGKRCRSDELPWVRAARTGKRIPPQEMTIRHTNGTGVTVLCSSSPVVDDVGQVIGAVAILQDISDRKEFERQKDEFLAIVAHEIRAPLTGIKGYIQLLKRRATRERKEHVKEGEIDILQVIERQANRLAGLVSGLQDFSRIQMHKLQLNKTRFCLGELAGNIVSQLREATPERHFEVTVRGDTTVNADPSRIEQVLMNLISNAVKATQIGGRIAVEIEQKGRKVVARVSDNGIGMSKETQKHVFERLYRPTEAGYREGMGLGLYITKGIIDAHGGKIGFESEEGRGTTFWFELMADS